MPLNLQHAAKKLKPPSNNGKRKQNTYVLLRNSTVMSIIHKHDSSKPNFTLMGLYSVALRRKNNNLTIIVFETLRDSSVSL